MRATHFRFSITGIAGAQTKLDLLILISTAAPAQKTQGAAKKISEQLPVFIYFLIDSI